jgi:hypothetical protein
VQGPQGARRAKIEYRRMHCYIAFHNQTSLILVGSIGQQMEMQARLLIKTVFAAVQYSFSGRKSPLSIRHTGYAFHE